MHLKGPFTIGYYDIHAHVGAQYSCTMMPDLQQRAQVLELAVEHLLCSEAGLTSNCAGLPPQPSTAYPPPQSPLHPCMSMIPRPKSLMKTAEHDKTSPWTSPATYPLGEPCNPAKTNGLARQHPHMAF